MISMLIFAAAVATTDSAAPSSPAAPSASVLALVEEYAARAPATLDENLVDYSSARIRSVRANYRILPGGKPTISFCGEINSTNRLGGYTGWQPFVLVGSDEPVLMLQNGIGPVGRLGPTVIARACQSSDVTWIDGDFTGRFAPPKE
jgi:hypothetical protein